MYLREGYAMARAKSMPLFGANEEVFHVKHFGIFNK
jgi:hypothetical protein